MKRPLPNLRCYLGIFIDGMSIAGLRAEIWTRDLPKSKNATH
jgi:hypothetical protein